MTVWTLLVINPDSKYPHVSVHASEEEARERFAEEYGADAEEYLEVIIDSHTV